MPDNQTPLPETCGCIDASTGFGAHLHNESCRYPEALRRIAELEAREVLYKENIRILNEVGTRIGLSRVEAERERDAARKALDSICTVFDGAGSTEASETMADKMYSIASVALGTKEER